MTTLAEVSAALGREAEAVAQASDAVARHAGSGHLLGEARARTLLAALLATTDPPAAATEAGAAAALLARAGGRSL